MTHEEMILKAKEAKSVEELLALAKENGMEMTEENAKVYFEQLHKSGELADEELTDVAGGGCNEGYTTVTCLTDCFTGEFRQISTADLKTGSLRETWHNSAFVFYGDTRVCGKCIHLGFHGGLGYCTLEKR